MKEQRPRTTADGSAKSCAVVVRRWSVVGGRKKKKTFTTKAQRAQKGKDASHKRQGHGEKRAMVCGLSLLDLGPP
jgi:hypothetical protein